MRVLRLLDGGQMLLVAVVVLVPVVWMVSASFKEPSAVTAFPPQFLFHPSLRNYAKLVETVPFARYALNSLIIASGATVIGIG
ncbi:MAG: carbohydrate ABC transporter permease, partial [Acetobacteraceae bacterium]